MMTRQQQYQQFKLSFQFLGLKFRSQKFVCRCNPALSKSNSDFREKLYLEQRAEFQQYSIISHLRNDTNLESAHIAYIKWFADWKGQQSNQSVVLIKVTNICSLLQYVLVSNCLQKKSSQFGDMNGRLPKNRKCMGSRVSVGDLLVA